MLQSIKGPGTLTYEDGEVFNVVVNVKFKESGGSLSGSGTVQSEQSFTIGMKDGMPLLNAGGRKIKVLITRAHIEGYAELTTSGPFIN